MLRRAALKWIKKHPTYWHDYYMAHRDVYIMRARFKNPLSLDAPLAENFTPLDFIADDKSMNPLEQLIQSEAINGIINRLISEKGLSHDEAKTYVL